MPRDKINVMYYMKTNPEHISSVMVLNALELKVNVEWKTNWMFLFEDFIAFIHRWWCGGCQLVLINQYNILAV